MTTEPKECPDCGAELIIEDGELICPVCTEETRKWIASRGNRK